MEIMPFDGESSLMDALEDAEHMRQEAEQCGLERIPLIVRELSDEDMLKFMARENQEDFNANFLVMLETWEAAVTFCASPQFLIMIKNPQETPQALDVAKFLGWTAEPIRKGSRQGGGALSERVLPAR